MAERRVRPYRAEDEARVVVLCVEAFEPIHRGFEAALGPVLFALEYPDWRGGYARQIAAVGEAAPALEMHVVEEAGRIVGFVQTVLHTTGLGEIGLNAVDPAAQGRGIGRFLYTFALGRLRERGACAACVGTGGDAAHAPARAAYRAAGFDRAIPSVHLYRAL